MKFTINGGGTDMKVGVRSLTLVVSGLFTLLLTLVAGCGNSNDSPTSPTGAGTSTFRAKLVTASSAKAAASSVRAATAAVPVARAQIAVDGVPTDTYTAADGTFELKLSPGPHVISIVGNPSAHISVNVDGLKAVVVELQLNSDGTLSSQQDKDKDGDIDEADDQNHDGEIQINEGDIDTGAAGNPGT
jgi:hypothetical protein